MRRDYSGVRTVCTIAGFFGWLVVAASLVGAIMVADGVGGFAAALALALPGLAGGFAAIALGAIGEAAAGSAESLAQLAAGSATETAPRPAAPAAPAADVAGAVAHARERSQAPVDDGVEYYDGAYHVGGQTFSAKVDALRYARAQKDKD